MANNGSDLLMLIIVAAAGILIFGAVLPTVADSIESGKLIVTEVDNAAVLEDLFVNSTTGNFTEIMIKFDITAITDIGEPGFNITKADVCLTNTTGLAFDELVVSRVANQTWNDVTEDVDSYGAIANGTSSDVAFSDTGSEICIAVFDLLQTDADADNDNFTVRIEQADAVVAEDAIDDLVGGTNVSLWVGELDNTSSRAVFDSADGTTAANLDIQHTYTPTGAVLALMPLVMIALVVVVLIGLFVFVLGTRFI